MSDLELFIIARWLYSIGEPIISDAEYQILLDTLMATDPDNPYLHRTWSDDPCPVELLKKYGYDNAIRSIILSDKSESIPSIGDWATFNSIYRDIDEEMTISIKHDGWNIQCAYCDGELVNIQTRGRSRDAMSAEILRNMIPHRITEMGKYIICCEATVSYDDYKILKKELNAKSQRGAVSSCLARVEYTDKITLHAFSIIGDKQILNPFPLLESWGFSTPIWKCVRNYNELLQAMHEFSDMRSIYPFPSDGLVVRGSFTRAIRLLAWEEKIYNSYVLGYDESYGLHRISVKAKIYPIKLANSTQRLIPVTNYQRVIDNNLRVGYPIAFRFASDAIADLDEKSTRLLQKQWEGRLDKYCEGVRESERIKAEI